METLHQHALLAEGVVVERAVDLVHPLLLRPGLGRADQQARDLDVPDAVEPAETGAALAVALVVAGVDHRADAPDDALAVEDEPELVRAVLERRDRGQRPDLVAVQGGHVLGAVLVQLVRETDELHQFLAGLDFTDLVIGHLLFK